MDQMKWQRVESFVASLDSRDLQRLRAITRRSFAQMYPKRPPLTDAVCDYYIEQLGPQAGEKALRAAVDARQVS